MQEVNYYFDKKKEHHPFTFELEANPHSLAPSNALRIAPIFKEGFHPCEKNGEWVQVKDYRNTDVYSKKTGEKIVIDNVGELSSELTTILPDCEYPVFDEELQKFVVDESRIVVDIPTLLSRFQMLTILKITKLDDGIGLYQATDNYMNLLTGDTAQNITMKTAWETAQEFKRDSALIQLIQAAFKLTDEQVDNLFVQGFKITA